MIVERAGQIRACGNAGPRGRAGFTLIEVLVVLAILVILFALLFAPMIASLDMVTVGQSRVTMQNAVRTAMEEMRRDISNAMYIYPTAGVSLKGADGLLGTGDDIRIPNLSEIVLVGPQRTAGGDVAQPMEPRTDATGRIIATRLRIALLDETQPYSEGNPFVLVREEGYYDRYEDATHVWWTFTNLGDPGEPIRNLLTPRSGYDFPVTQSVCSVCGAVYEGYADTCSTGCGGTDLIYLHENLQFRPERIIGEVLPASAHNTIYQARHAAWAGFHNPGDIEINDLLPNDPAKDPLMQLGASPLDPQIVIINPATDPPAIMRDLWQAVDNSKVVLTWNSDSGTVRVGATTGRWVVVTNPNATNYPGGGIQPGEYYTIAIQDQRPDLGPGTPSDQYDKRGAIATTRQWDLVPVYPSLGALICTDCGGRYDPTQYNVGDPCPNSSCSGTLVSTAQAGDPAMPIAYRIDPTRGGVEPPAKIVPGSIRVIVWGMDDNGTPYQAVYSETTDIDPTRIGPRQFAVVRSDYDQRAEVRFNELAPPSPTMLTNAGITLSSFGVYIQYYSRRNYDPAAPQNDYIIKADYSTHEIINLDLTLQRYAELEPITGDPTRYVVPSDIRPDRVSARDQVTVRNLSR